MMSDVEKRLTDMDFSELSRVKEPLRLKVMAAWEKSRELSDGELDGVVAAGQGRAPRKGAANFAFPTEPPLAPQPRADAEAERGKLMEKLMGYNPFARK